MILSFKRKFQFPVKLSADLWIVLLERKDLAALTGEK